MPRPVNDLTGRKFGKLTAIGVVRPVFHAGAQWVCFCECGVLTIVASRSLISKSSPTRSCGCLSSGLVRRKLSPTVKHGHCVGGQTPTYKIYAGILDRCCNPSSPLFPEYGGRGISICDRWRNNFSLFVNDMGERPSKRHSIDRINGLGNYEPGNCRWATYAEQNRNTSRNVMLTKDGQTKCVKDWCDELGINPNRVAYRLSKGLSAELALSTKTYRGGKLPTC